MLHGVHSDLVLVVSRGLLYSEVDFAVTEGLRGMDRQIMLLDSGRSKTLQSKHLAHDDGMSRAIDVMAVGDLDGDGDVDAQDRAITWNREWYGAIADGMHRASMELGIGIRWGGDFKTRGGKPWYDGPHFELR